MDFWHPNQMMQMMQPISCEKKELFKKERHSTLERQVVGRPCHIMIGGLPDFWWVNTKCVDADIVI